MKQKPQEQPSDAMVVEILGAVDAALAEPIDARKKARLSRTLADILRHGAVHELCRVVDEMRSRGLGVSAISAGSITVQLFQLPPPGKKTNGVSDEHRDDPLFDGIR